METFTKRMKKEILQQREDEQRVLNGIAELATFEFAEKTAGVLEAKKHCYHFEGYLSLLQMLATLLLEGVPPDDALDAVQTGWSTEKILERWRYMHNGT